MKWLPVLIPLCCLTLACGGVDRDDDRDDEKRSSADAGTCVSSGGAFGGSSGGSCGTTPPSTLGKRCQAATECGAKESCQSLGYGDYYCMANCAANADCGAGATCILGGTAGPGFCAKSCTQDSECPGDLACITSDDGSIRACAANRRGGTCQRRDDCGYPEYFCVGSAGQSPYQDGVCIADCSKNAAICGKGAQCFPNFNGTGVSACLRPCTSAAQCGRFQVCSAGACVPELNTTPRPIGSACTSTSQCEGGLFCATSDEFPLGYCTKQCGEGVGTCEGATTCIIVDASTNLCMNKCYEPGTQSDCRDFYRCSQVTGEDYGVCVVQ